MEVTIIIVINHFVIIINYCNCFDKALTEIFQFCRALSPILIKLRKQQFGWPRVSRNIFVKWCAWTDNSNHFQSYLCTTTTLRTVVDRWSLFIGSFMGWKLKQGMLTAIGKWSLAHVWLYWSYSMRYYIKPRLLKLAYDRVYCLG